jgi:hypothetical protein
MFRGMFGGKKRSIGKTGEKLPEKSEALPDSTLPQGLCPRCQKQSSFEVAGTKAVTFDPDLILVEPGKSGTAIAVDQVSVLYCRNCKQGIVVVEEQCIADRSCIPARPPFNGGCRDCAAISGTTRVKRATFYANASDR